jgi:hypothetical protein
MKFTLQFWRRKLTHCPTQQAATRQTGATGDDNSDVLFFKQQRTRFDTVIWQLVQMLFFILVSDTYLDFMVLIASRLLVGRYSLPVTFFSLLPMQ